MKKLILIFVGLLILPFVPVSAAPVWNHINMGVNVNGTNWSVNTTGAWADGAWAVGDGIDAGDPYWYHYAQPRARITWLNPLHIYYTKMRLYGVSGTIWWTCNGVAGRAIDGWGDNFSISGSGPITCTNETETYARLREMLYENGTQPQTEVNFTGYPLSGSSPLNVDFTITNFSTGVYPGSSSSWTFGDGTIESSTSSIINHTYLNPGTYTVALTYSNLSNINYTITKTNYITAYALNGLHLLLEIRDIETRHEITQASVGIRNSTTGLWHNFTTPTGSAFFDSTTLIGNDSLSIGQVVLLKGNASGYDEKTQSVTIPYNNYVEQIFLTRTQSTAVNGTWNLVVLTKSNKYGTPVRSATVKLITGVSGGLHWEGLSDDNGITSFMNVTPSATALVDVIAQGYQSASAVVTVIPNSSQRVTIELVKIGDTPVATPLPTETKVIQTGVPTPGITDENGNPITSPEGKAQWGLDQLFNIIPQIAIIVASLIIAWLFWRGFDIATNGMGPLILRRVIEGFIKQMFK